MLFLVTKLMEKMEVWYAKDSQPCLPVPIIVHLSTDELAGVVPVYKTREKAEEAASHCPGAVVIPIEAVNP